MDGIAPVNRSLGALLLCVADAEEFQGRKVSRVVWNLHNIIHIEISSEVGILPLMSFSEYLKKLQIRHYRLV
jgi:hypothetical protein